MTVTLQIGTKQSYDKAREMIMAKKYTLELTEEQYDLIALSVEVVHRIIVGQVEELDQILPNLLDRDLLVKLKEQAFPELSFNQSYKWCGGYKGSDDEKKNKAFSHYQAATYAIYREMPVQLMRG